MRIRSDLARFGRGFVYAWNGIRAAVKEERNFRFHICAAFYAYAAAWLAGCTAVELALLSLCVFAVMAMELMNSAVERAVDKPDTTHWWSAGAAKDMAAGAVLFLALGALAVGGCLFLPRLNAIGNALRQSPWIGVVCAAALIPAYFFIFRYHPATQKGESTNGKTDS